MQEATFERARRLLYPIRLREWYCLRCSSSTSSMRKIIVSIATSADGFIARKDGGIDWLEDPRYKGPYGMIKFFKSIDTILWGRKTYDLMFKFAKEGKHGP